MTSILKADTIQDTDGNNIINESGNTITIGASGDTTNIVGTLQNNGSAVGGTNTPAFEAYTTGAQSVTDGTFTKLTFATEVFDTDNDYDNSSNYRFTPQVAGKYFFYAKMTTDPSSYENEKNSDIKFYKNGSAVSYTLSNTMTGGNTSSDGSTATTHVINATIDLNGSSDYVEVYGKLTTWSGSGATIKQKQFGGYKIIE